MTDRVILGSLPGGGYGLRVSNPGFDVKSQSLNGRQLSFDSRYQKAPRVHMVITKPPNSAAQWFYFGKTFAAPPPFLFTYRDSYATYNTDYKIFAANARAIWRDTRNESPFAAFQLGSYVNRIWLPAHDGVTSAQLIILDIE